MEPDILNPRRVPRVPVRCAVEIRHVFTSWTGQTEDLGPGGCQIVSARVVPPGRSLRLSIRCDAIGRTVSATGKVVWAHGEAPARLGVEFDRAAVQGSWFQAILAADAEAARAVRSTIDRLPRHQFVYLGRPPEIVVDFSPDEMAVLRGVGGGILLGALARSLEPGFDRLRGVVFSLVQRRLLVFDPGRSPGAPAWRHVLGAPPVVRARVGATPLPSATPAPLPPSPPASPARPTPPPTPAKRLYDEGQALLREGRMELAVERFRAALLFAPDDELIWAALEKLRAWA